MTKKKTILVTNDDGIYGPGLQPLVKELKRLGNVHVVVPDQERSGTSHSITLHKPLRIQSVDRNTWIMNGTPADCVRYGTLSLLKGNVDLIVSGINSGPNMGNDVVYSGTVAGAREGALLKKNSFAVSVADAVKPNFPLAATVARMFGKLMLRTTFKEQLYMNINVPSRMKGMQITRLGQRIYDEEIDCRVDPRGHKYYWLVGKFVKGIHEQGSDITAVSKDIVSITPLQINPAAEHLFPMFKQWIKDIK
jgi:5'-nucleotidase